MRNRSFGGEDAEVGDKVVAQLADLVTSINGFREQPMSRASVMQGPHDQIVLLLEKVVEGMRLAEGVESTQETLRDLSRNMMKLARFMHTIHHEKKQTVGEKVLSQLDALLEEMKKSKMGE